MRVRIRPPQPSGGQAPRPLGPLLDDPATEADPAPVVDAVLDQGCPAGLVQTGDDPTPRAALREEAKEAVEALEALRHADTHTRPDLVEHVTKELADVLCVSAVLMVETESKPCYLARRASPHTQSLPSRRIAQSQPSRRSRSSSPSGSTKFLITRNVVPSRSRRSTTSSRPTT